jgi:hypothetical protein
MAYYWYGISGNFAKLGIAGPVAEVAWLSALQASFSFPLSNLGRRPVDVYTNIKSTTRFAPPSIGTVNSLPIRLKCSLSFPAQPTWQPYA